MIHYHVWFNLKPGVAESFGLSVVSDYLSHVCGLAESESFLLLKNRGSPPRSKLPAFHALVEFADSQRLSVSMKNQVARGIHQGLHGRMVEVVCDFQVEIFELVEPESIEGNISSLGELACEI